MPSIGFRLRVPKLFPNLLFAANGACRSCLELPKDAKSTEAKLATRIQVCGVFLERLGLQSGSGPLLHLLFWDYLAVR